MFINDLHQAIKKSSLHHFADDTSLILTEKSLKEINKYIIRDLKCAVDQIKANKLSLNTSKQKWGYLKYFFLISGLKIQLSKSVKYLGIILQDDLYWNLHLSQLCKKLSQGTALLSKIRHHVPKSLLKTIYYSIFNSCLIYASEIWGQIWKQTF